MHYTPKRRISQQESLISTRNITNPIVEKTTFFNCFVLFWGTPLGASSSTAGKEFVGYADHANFLKKISVSNSLMPFPSLSPEIMQIVINRAVYIDRQGLHGVGKLQITSGTFFHKWKC